MQADLADLATDDVELLTVSTDSMYALRAFADQEGFTFSMLSDFWPHGAVADAYGVLHPDVGVALRGTFLVDRDGVIRWSVVNGIGDARDIGDYKRAITALSSAVGALVGRYPESPGRIAQLARAPALQAGGRRFKSVCAHRRNRRSWVQDRS